MNLDAELFRPRFIPMRSAQAFLVYVLPQLGWGKTYGDEIILDVGCGPGEITQKLILPLFSSSSRIFATDTVPNMIALAQKQNSSPQIEYSMANIGDWSSVQHWMNKITKLVSISVFQWLKDQRNAFRNVYQLLQKGGEAAFFFPLQTTFYALIIEIQNSPKWSHLFHEIDNYIPLSEYGGHDASFYKKLLEGMGFEVLYCRCEEKIDAFPSEETYRDFFASICVLRKYVPAEHLKEFEQDFMKTFYKMNGRDVNGILFHKGNFIELVIRKK